MDKPAQVIQPTVVTCVAPPVTQVAPSVVTVHKVPKIEEQVQQHHVTVIKVKASEPVTQVSVSAEKPVNPEIPC